MRTYEIGAKLAFRHSGSEVEVTDYCLAGDIFVYQLTWPDGSTGLWTETSVQDEFKPKATFFEIGKTYGYNPGGETWFVDSLKEIDGQKFAWAAYSHRGRPMLTVMVTLTETNFKTLKLMD